MTDLPPKIVMGVAMLVGGTGGVVAVSQDHISTIGLLAAVVGGVAAIMAWHTNSIKSAISAHEKTEFEKQEAREKLATERHHGVLREIQFLNEKVDIRSEMRAQRVSLKGEVES